MKRILTIAASLVFVFGCSGPQTENVSDSRTDLLDDAPGFVLSDDLTEVRIGEDGTLLVLRNKETGHNYAGGAGLWRLFYNTLEEKEMQID